MHSNYTLLIKCKYTPLYICYFHSHVVSRLVMD